MDSNGNETPPPQIQSIDQPGVRATGSLLMDMRKEVASLLGRPSTGFPGAQPVSFSRKHIEELKREDYYVCEKSDGMRYLLYITQDDHGTELHYFIDRKNDYWWVNHGSLHFPLPNDEAKAHSATVLDGELVIDTLEDGSKEPRYLVFDCLVLNGQVLMNRELGKRLGYFQEQVFKPYKALMDKYPVERPFQPFFVDLKSMQFAYGVQMIFDVVIQKLKHGNDGLIFTCLNSFYKPGTDPHILKWKDAEENTIDFIWKLEFPVVSPTEEEIQLDGITEPFIDYDAVPTVRLLANHGGGWPSGYQHYADMHLEEAEWEELKSLGDPLDERVVEAHMDSQKRWRFYRFRDDKSDGNHISTVNSVIESIQDGVTKDDLINASKTVRDNWKAREHSRRAAGGGGGGAGAGGGGNAPRG
ncbi:mRNA capping enzyme [Xylariaceae sp. FL0255]|nr:mRNA capping enzyme [Xylariaceae sp. FL0255]